MLDIFTAVTSFGSLVFETFIYSLNPRATFLGASGCVSVKCLLFPPLHLNPPVRQLLYPFRSILTPMIKKVDFFGEAEEGEEEEEEEKEELCRQSDDTKFVLRTNLIFSFLARLRHHQLIFSALGIALVPSLWSEARGKRGSDAAVLPGYSPGRAG